jgi:hypothetical protein
VYSIDTQEYGGVRRRRCMRDNKPELFQGWSASPYGRCLTDRNRQRSGIRFIRSQLENLPMRPNVSGRWTVDAKWELKYYRLRESHAVGSAFRSLRRPVK